MVEQRSTLEYALLGLIRGAPQSGYDLRKVFEETAMAGYSGSPGAIYPALRRLEHSGLIEGDVPDDTRRRRKEFRLTERGRAVLLDWLALPVTHDDVALRFPELMLRFVFLSFDESDSLTLRFLERLESHLGEYIADLKVQREQLPLTMHGRLALEGGIASSEARHRWALEAQESFRRKGDRR
ncbi:MAG: PadR family transcriptional regulator [Gemmatimonadota bacterium]